MPTAILAHTTKGRGVSFTEGRSEWHARPATADEAADRPRGSSRTRRRGGRAVSKPQRDVWAETLVELAATNPDILVMDADLATSTKADRFAAAYPDRFLQMGIAEQGMVGAAAGLSFTGYVPWLSSFGIFFTNRALDQVRMSVAQTHANVKIGAAYTGLMAGLAGKTHVDVSDLATMRAMPGMTILAPADAAGDGRDDPLGHRDPGTRLPAPRPRGRARRVRAGLRLRAAARRSCSARGRRSCSSPPASRRPGPSRRRSCWATTGSRAGVLHVPSIKPVDAAAIAAAAANVPVVVTVEEHTVIGGLGGLVAEIVTANDPRPVIRIGIEDTWGESAPNAWLLERHGLTPERVAERVRRVWNQE